MKQKVAEKPEKVRLAKPDEIVESIKQSVSHRSSHEIIRMRAVRQYALEAIESEIIYLSAKIADARNRHATTQAIVRGLGQVLKGR